MITLKIQTIRKITELSDKEKQQIDWTYYPKTQYNLITEDMLPIFSSMGVYFCLNDLRVRQQVYKVQLSNEIAIQVLGNLIKNDEYSDYIINSIKLTSEIAEAIQDQLIDSRVIDKESWQQTLLRNNIISLDDMPNSYIEHDIAFLNSISTDQLIRYLKRSNYLAESIDGYCYEDEYLSLKNSELKELGLPTLDVNCTIQYLKEEEACSSGIRYAKKLFKELGKESLTWDEYVDYLRSKEKTGGNIEADIGFADWIWYNQVSDVDMDENDFYREGVNETV